MTAAPFVVPGLALTDVLEAIKRPDGKRLYDILVRTASELTELATQNGGAGAAPPTAPAPPPAKPRQRDAGLSQRAPSAKTPQPDRSITLDADRLPPVTAAPRTPGSVQQRTDRIVAAYEQRRGEWLATGTIARATGEAPDYVTATARKLAKAGRLEHNGGHKGSSCYRAPERQATNGAAPSISRRVQRELEAERQAADRAAAAAPATNGSGTLLGQALHALIMRPATIPELAARLNVSRADAARVIRQLEDDDDLARRGRRRGEIIYEGRP